MKINSNSKPTPKPTSSKPPAPAPAPEPPAPALARAQKLPITVLSPKSTLRSVDKKPQTAAPSPDRRYAFDARKPGSGPLSLPTVKKPLLPQLKNKPLNTKSISRVASAHQKYSFDVLTPGSSVLSAIAVKTPSPLSVAKVSLNTTAKVPVVNNRVAALQDTNGGGDISEIRKKFNLAPDKTRNILSLRPSTADGSDLTYGQTLGSKMLSDLQGVTSFTYHKGDVRSDFITALEATNVLESGRIFFPFYQDSKGNRKFADGGNTPLTQRLNPADAADLIDRDAVKSKFSELLTKPALAQTFGRQLQNTLNGVHLGSTTDEIYGAVTSSRYIQALKSLGNGPAASGMVSEDLGALSMLDPSKALKAGRKLKINAMQDDFLRTLQNPALVDGSNFEQATADAINLAELSLKRGDSKLTSDGKTSINAETTKYLDGIDPGLISYGVGRALKNLSNKIVEGKEGFTDLPTITQQQFDAALPTDLMSDQKPVVSEFFDQMKKDGLWGAIGGGSALAAFGYKLGKGDPAWYEKTALERMGAARDAISFLAAEGDSETGAAITDKMKSLVGEYSGGRQAWNAVGLDNTLAGVMPSSDAYSKFPTNYSPMFASYNFSGKLSNPIEQKAASNLGDTFWAKFGKSSNAQQMSSRVGITMAEAMKFYTASGGANDIVDSALRLKENIHDTGGVLSSSPLGDIGSVENTRGVFGLFASDDSMLPKMVTPMFMAAAILGISNPPGGFYDAIKWKDSFPSNKFTGGAELDEFMQRVIDGGMSTEDSKDKFDYMQTAFCKYGNDNLDSNIGYIESQSAEWQHFHSLKDSLRGNWDWRTDRNLHISNSTTRNNPNAQ